MYIYIIYIHVYIIYIIYIPIFRYRTVSPNPGEASFSTAADDANTVTAGGASFEFCPLVRTMLFNVIHGCV